MNVNNVEQVYPQHTEKNIYFTKEITEVRQIYYRDDKSNQPVYSQSELLETNRFCPRCDGYHNGNCNLIQMVITLNTNCIERNTFCKITFYENIKLPLWNKNVKKEPEFIDSNYVSRYSEKYKNFLKKMLDKQFTPAETANYKYNDNVHETSFGIKLFEESFADDELESFRSNLKLFVKFFNVDITQHVDKIKYLLLTEYKNSYIQKKDFLNIHFPTLYDKIKLEIINNMKNSGRPVIQYSTLNQKSNFILNEVINKLIKLYVDFFVDPLFEASNFGNQKPNPHIGKKAKLK